MKTFFRWFTSRTVRQATELCRRVRKFVNAQRDLLGPQAINAIIASTAEVRGAIQSGADPKTILDRCANLEAISNKWLKPFPHASARENVDVILVALAVALGIRTFFLQPMAIPTGSMQPTLYGITDSRGQSGVLIPSFPIRIFQSLVYGISYYHEVARSDGAFEGYGPVENFFRLPFVKKVTFFVGDEPYTIWFPPDKFEERFELAKGKVFHRGDDIIKLKVTSGDRLFVDRFTYNFRRPERGEIIIFATHGIDALQQDTHYIKRLIAFGGEAVQIGDDRHVIINGKRIDATTPHFENLYSFSGPPERSHYSGHLNNAVGKHYVDRDVAPKFENASDMFTVRPGHFLVMGDNTLDSYDSRYWGDFPREKVIGKCAFVFWPISERFGWGFR